MKATYAKSKKDGGWNIRVECEDPFGELPEIGSTITVEKRSGERTEQKLGSQLWKGDNDGVPVAIYQILS